MVDWTHDFLDFIWNVTAMIEVNAQLSQCNHGWEVLDESFLCAEEYICLFCSVEALRPASVHCGLQKARDALAEAKWTGLQCRKSTVCVIFACQAKSMNSVSAALMFSSVMFIQDPLFTGHWSELRGTSERDMNEVCKGQWVILEKGREKIMKGIQSR